MSVQTCHRCDVEMSDDGVWFVCPCCRIRTRGLDRQREWHQEHMRDLGLSEVEYDARCRSLINTEPVPAEVLERAADRLAEEWQPACEHDHPNPFRRKDMGGRGAA